MKTNSKLPLAIFLFLLFIAATWNSIGPALLVFAAVVLFLVGWVQLARRFPMTMIVISSLLFGGRGRRGRW